MRLQSKVAIVVGAGQTPGDTIGNGRATAILFAREGARLFLVDRNRESARETQAMIEIAMGDLKNYQPILKRYGYLLLASEPMVKIPEGILPPPPALEPKIFGH